MVNRTELKSRLLFWQSALEKLRNAYLALVDGGIKSYSLEDRQITKLDLPELQRKIEEAERKVDELSARVRGGTPRKAVGVIPRDW